MDSNALKDRVNDVLECILISAATEQNKVGEAACYSVLGNGHRWRPILLIQTGIMYGCTIEKLASAAAAVEFLHCASIILDDLPCMDNSEVRRGKPSCHVRFGDATSILAALDLTMRACSLFADYEEISLPSEMCSRVREMIAGQFVDLSSTMVTPYSPAVEQRLIEKSAAKTVLIRFAINAGASIGGAPNEHKKALDNFAQGIALAYQFLDDISDADGTALQQGKPAYMDADKLTAVGVYGLEGARQKASALFSTACAYISSLSAYEPLIETAQLLCQGVPLI